MEIGPEQPPPLMRRTRFVCVSDTHNCTPRLSPGDVLIHAGDLTNQGSFSELSRAMQWLEKADFEAKIIIAGNHDITLDQKFYAAHRFRFHNRDPQDAAKCLALLQVNPTITYLCHSQAHVRLKSPKGPQTSFTVFGSPYSPLISADADQDLQFESPWAFQYSRAKDSTGLGPWASIPIDTDILVTHTPPLNHCDSARCRGCKALLHALHQLRPRLHVCGHVHEGRGAHRVRWRPAQAGNIRQAAAALCAGFAVGEIEKWQDPAVASKPKESHGCTTHTSGRNKMSLVDLTSRGKGSWSKVGRNQTIENEFWMRESEHWDENELQPEQGVKLPRQTSTSNTTSDHVKLAGAEDGYEEAPRADCWAWEETCVVNCAIMATSWPHRGGKRLNEPIVVDMDLPVWT